ncbi:MAG: GFA family protein [Roseobacter sp.]
MHELTGQCLCGAVTITVQSESPRLRACHCDMCRRHTSAMFMSISVAPDTMIIDGPATSYVSSDWAERGFCATCGSTLWYGTREDGMRHPAAGLFDNAAGAELKLEFFSDRCPTGYALAGDHRRLDTDETIKLFTSQGDTQ